jgi:predicted DNA-binding protein YlxM (UPF0122 family)
MDHDLAMGQIAADDAQVEEAVQTIFGNVYFDIWKLQVELQLLKNPDLRHKIKNEVDKKMKLAVNQIENAVIRHTSKR